MTGSSIPLRDVYATMRRIVAAPRRKPSTGPREHGRQALLSTGPLSLADHAAEEARLGNCAPARQELAYALQGVRHLGGVAGPLRNVLDNARDQVRAACPTKRRR